MRTCESCYSYQKPPRPVHDDDKSGHAKVEDAGGAAGDGDNNHGDDDGCFASFLVVLYWLPIDL